MVVLDKIIKAARDREVSFTQRELEAALKKPTRPLTKKFDGNTIIAELKYTSPSEQKTFSGEGVGEVISAYARGGAAALSILTEPSFFDGNPEFIGKAKKYCSLPIVRKDFLLNQKHLEESRVIGADAVLLITRILGDNLQSMIRKAEGLGLWPLVETHSEEEVDAAVAAGAKHIGVNNRDLDTLKIDLDTTVKLCEMVPKDVFFITESGIKEPEDIAYLKERCTRQPDAYLVGGSLMKAKDKETSVKELVDA